MIKNGISNDDVGIKNKRNVNSWLKMRFPMMMLELKKKIKKKIKINWNDFKLKTGSWSIVTENG